MIGSLSKNRPVAFAGAQKLIGGLFKLIGSLSKNCFVAVVGHTNFNHLTLTLHMKQALPNQPCEVYQIVPWNIFGSPCQPVEFDWVL